MTTLDHINQAAEVQPPDSYARTYWAKHHRRINKARASLDQHQALIDRKVYAVGVYLACALAIQIAKVAA